MSPHALTTPNDVCRAGCDLALRTVALNRDWQHEWQVLAGRRIDRDRDAVRHLQQALAEAKAWTAFGEAARKVMCDYTTASVAIWQDAAELCMRGQFESASAWRTWLRDYGTETDSLPDLGRLAVINEASMPWRDWMAAFELGITETVGANDGTPVAARRLAGIDGEREHDHVR
ncbi:hypothetical protein BBJ41_37075 [Burkholderia stabilis]|uniref:hypothetical protein n=1 Tax=Burkholderia stabilis TaxID=95485 RepID=UPI000851C335|nr:hypothetical protein [Burkholderia stabilis]AOR73158.1 hypothetical protein BBJ41_37075 [Burkholderia stabilis]HDR9494625.1 hypothetical protein [Burkholderia stabilis]HDR9524341.1 hypothetical protein [Burkholderia stabilis]HDR9541498.1 hypothetical protein [Burkholderia stabilis]HDR9571314.1 hypothetical protein [Burkholderia stabilis]